jgi:anti-anti-sigma factor
MKSLVDAPIYDDGVLRIAPLEQQAGLVLSGEIDESTYAALLEVLEEQARANGHGEIHLDLAGVEFCDAAGLHAMVRLASGMGEHGRLVLHGPAPSLRAMLRIAGWDKMPQLAVEDT